MTILLHQNHQATNPFTQQPITNSHHSFQMPKILLDSHTNMIGLIPFQQNSKMLGSNCFWSILLSYLQIQHYNLQFSKIFVNHKPKQTQIDSKQQQPEEDAISISSSINIRQRKVSFGIVNYRTEQNNRKKTKKPQNMWMILNQNDQNKLNQLKQTQKIINPLINKIKLLVYEYAYKKDQTNPNSQPLNSIRVAKAFKALFPTQQKQLQNIFLYQKSKISSIIEFLALTKAVHQQKADICSRNIMILFEALNQVAINKILHPNNNKNYPHNSQEKKTQFIENMKELMGHFGFWKDKDFKIIKAQNENNPQSSTLLNPYLEKPQQKQRETSQVCGLQFKNGFYRIFLTQSGYMTSINIDSLQNVIENVKKHFIKPFDQLKTKQHRQQETINQNKNPEGSVLTWQQTHFHQVTPQNFISRYNNRYFKNQRLLYKQKPKLESRFKQQQVQDLIPQQNYECEYQILINSRNGKRQSNSRQSQSQLAVQIQNNLKTVHSNVNPILGHSFAQRMEPQLTQMRQNYKEKKFTHEYRQFQMEEQQLVQFSLRQSTQGYKNRRTLLQEELQRLYKREDFEISDNEILDDIERVLI